MPLNPPSTTFSTALSSMTASSSCKTLKLLTQISNPWTRKCWTYYYFMAATFFFFFWQSFDLVIINTHYIYNSLFNFEFFKFFLKIFFRFLMYLHFVIIFSFYYTRSIFLVLLYVLVSCVQTNDILFLTDPGPSMLVYVFPQREICESDFYLPFWTKVETNFIKW